MTARSQYKQMRARKAFEDNIGWTRKELRTTSRTDHLAPIVQFLEWLLPECGPPSLLTQRYQRELDELREQIATHRAPQPPVKARPKLRLVK